MKRVIALIAIVALVLVPMAALAAGPQGGMNGNGNAGKQTQGGLCLGGGQCQNYGAGTAGSPSGESHQYCLGKDRQGTGIPGQGIGAGAAGVGSARGGMKNTDRLRNQTRICDGSCVGCRSA
jgi:hypothetical protein